MQTGDLVVISAVYREGTLTPTLTIGNDGGQEWTAETQQNRSSTRHRVFHCVFDGTWDANPTVTVTSGTQPMMATMLVYRPATSSAFVFDASAGGDQGPPASSTTDLVRALPAATGAGVSLVLHASQIPNVWANQDWAGVDGGSGATNEYRRIQNSFGASLAFSERLRTDDEAAQDLAIRQTSGTLATNTWTFVSYREVPTGAALEAAVSASATASATLTTGVLLAATPQATGVAEAILLGVAPPLGASASAGASIVATLRGSEPHAVIEDGRVVGIIAGPPPASTASTFVWPIGEPTEYPRVGWYFVEPCNVFSATAPVRAPGDIVPPFPPNADTPPDEEEYEPDPEIDGPAPADEEPVLTTPHLVSFHAHRDETVSVVATEARTELAARLRTLVDLSTCVVLRLQAHIVTPLAGAQLVLMCTTDQGTTWQPVWHDEDDTNLAGPTLYLSAPGTRAGRERPPSIPAEVVVSPFIENGDNTSVVVLGNVNALMWHRPGERIPAYCPPWGALWEVSTTGVEDLSSNISVGGEQAGVFLFFTWMNTATDTPVTLDAGSRFNDGPALVFRIGGVWDDFRDVIGAFSFGSIDSTSAYALVYELPATIPGLASMWTVQQMEANYDANVYGGLFDDWFPNTIRLWYAYLAGTSELEAILVLAADGAFLVSVDPTRTTNRFDRVRIADLDVFCGRRRQFVVVSELVNGNTAMRVSIYCNAPCAAPTRVAVQTFTMGDPGSAPQAFYVHSTGFSEFTAPLAPGMDLRVWRAGLDRTASPFL
jgi:hypothetical protein